MSEYREFNVLLRELVARVRPARVMTVREWAADLDARARALGLRPPGLLDPDERTA